MSSFKELQKYIRYQLNQLKALNKHHEFEHLTRQFARARICKNIIPSTGPVGSGGDFGSDFESFRSYLQSSPISKTSSLGLATNKKIVFACSLNKQITSKIKKDVAIICKHQEQIDAIYYFCEADIPIGKRKSLIKWCKDNYTIDVEILDGQALAELLSSIDLFWIAAEYLDVPSNMYPEYSDKSSKYKQYKQNWLTNDTKPTNHSDFFEIKFGLRQSTFNKDCKHDLTAWIKKIEEFMKPVFPKPLKRKAMYEICVASLRGLNNLNTKINIIEEYFKGLDNLENKADIQDATTLLSYCSTAHLFGDININSKKLHNWSKKINAIIESKLGIAPGPGTRCDLLLIKSQACLLQFLDGPEPDLNLKSALNVWAELMIEVDNAPLFPLEHFADIVNLYIEFLGEEDEFINLCSELDEKLSKRSGGFIAAEKCFKRAFTYHNSQKYLLAIDQLHNARINWFTSETLYNSILSMILVSECYQKIGLIYAAKNYAAGAVFTIFKNEEDHIKKLLPSALFRFLECTYSAGEWLTYVQVMPTAFITHLNYDKSPLDFEQNNDISRATAYFTILHQITKEYDDSLNRMIEDIFRNSHLQNDVITILLDIVTNSPNYWESKDISIFWDRAQSDLLGRPFCDLGERRIIKWRAMGISWEVTFDNDYETTAIIEEFVSTLQILIAEISKEDFCILPSNVVLECQLIETSDFVSNDKPDNDNIRLEILLPRILIDPDQNLVDLRGKIFAMCVHIFIKCSALRPEIVVQIFKEHLSKGISQRTFNVRPFSELFMYILDKTTFESTSRKNLIPLEHERQFSLSENSQLKWADGPGPGYSTDKATTFLKNRYENAINPIRLTLPRLLQNKEFKDKVKKLKKEGYLDWQIIQIISNIVVDSRSKILYPTHKPSKELDELMKDQFFRNENETDIKVPPEIFTDELIEIFKFTFIGAVAQTWNLRINRETPDFKALKKVLDIRYNNSTDDIKHHNYLKGI